MFTFSFYGESTLGQDKSNVVVEFKTNTCIKVILVLWWGFFPFPAFVGFQMQTYT